MADKQPSPSTSTRPRRSTATNPQVHTTLCSYLSRLRRGASCSSICLLSLAVVAGVLAVGGTALVLVLFSPVVILFSPVWIPVAMTMFAMILGAIWLCGLGAAVVIGGLWLYKYAARRRLAETASHMKECAREYGGYLQSRVRDVAPGA